MNIAFIEFNNENEELIAFLTSQPWPYHGNPNPSAESIRDGIANGRFAGEETRTLWIAKDGTNVGIVRLFDLGDLTPVFDIRIEGHTRNDNFAMRKTFAKAGFAKEAYHRKAWPTEGAYYDSVGYSLLREDWEEGKISPIDWNDFPY